MARTKPNTQCAGAAWMNMVEQQRKRALNRLPIYNIRFTHTHTKPKGREREWGRSIDWGNGIVGKRTSEWFALTRCEHGKVHAIDLKFPKNMNNRQKWNCTYSNRKLLSHTAAVFCEKFGSSWKWQRTKSIFYTLNVWFSIHSKEQCAELKYWLKINIPWTVCGCVDVCVCAWV